MKKTKNISNIIDKDVIPIIVYNEPDKNYIIEKNNNNKKIISKTFIKNNKNIKEKYYKYLNNFIDTLNTHLSPCDFNNFKNNIKTLEINDKISKVMSITKYAAYFVLDNKIEIYNIQYFNSIYHELLHMASNKKINDNLILNGFSMIDFKNKKKYGVFITEGYTEYLCLKYFNISNTYKTQISFIKQLEKIVGENLMKKMYFNADLKGLINVLMKYNNTKEEVLEFIINTDFIHKYQYSINPIYKLKIKKACIKVNAFLIKSYYSKLKNQYENKEKRIIYLNKYINELINIDVGFISNYHYIKNIYKYYDKEIKQKKLTQ